MRTWFSACSIAAPRLDRRAGGAVGDPQEQRCRTAARRGRAGAPRRRSRSGSGRVAGDLGDPQQRVAAEQQARRPPRSGAAAGRRTRSGTCAARSSRLGSRREGHPLDPLRVVDAGQRRDDHPRREAVVEREVRAVDLQREQRAARRRPGRRLSVAWRNAPPSCSDSTRTSASPLERRPSPRRSASRTPVHVCQVVQPSTQAIGRRSVCCVHRQQVVAAELDVLGAAAPAPAASRRRSAPASPRPSAAVLLTWKSFGPGPPVCPRGESSAISRSAAEQVRARRHRDERRASRGRRRRASRGARSSARRGRGGEGVDLGVGGAHPLDPLAERPEGALARERRGDDRQLQDQVQGQRAEEDHRRVVVGGQEGEAERAASTRC